MKLFHSCRDRIKSFSLAVSDNNIVTKVLRFLLSVCSGIEYPNEIFSLCQLPNNTSPVKTTTPVSPVKKLLTSAPSSTFVTKPTVTGVPPIVTGVRASVTAIPLVTGVTPNVSGVPAKASIPADLTLQPSVPAVSCKPPNTQAKPLTAPLEAILPLPEGVVIPKVTPYGGSLGTPLPLQQTLKRETLSTGQLPTAPPSSGQIPRAPGNAALSTDQISKPAPDPYSVASRFFSSYLQPDNPLVRALIADNNVLNQPPRPQGPQAATAKIFVPRTEEMNKGYLTFADDNTGITSEYCILFIRTGR